MRELVVNGQIIPQTTIPTVSHSTDYRQDLNPYYIDRIAISNLTGNITIKPHDQSCVTITANNPDLSCFHEQLAGAIAVSGPKLPPPEIHNQITFPPSIAPTELTIYIPSHNPSIPDIFLENLEDTVTITHHQRFNLHIHDCPNCKINVTDTEVRTLTAVLTGNCAVEIDRISSNVNASLHDNASMLIHSGEIPALHLATYGNAYARIKVPITAEATLTNAGLHNIHLEKVTGSIIPILTGSGDIVIDDCSSPSSD